MDLRRKIVWMIRSQFRDYLHTFEQSTLWFSPPVRNLLTITRAILWEAWVARVAPMANWRLDPASHYGNWQAEIVLFWMHANNRVRISLACWELRISRGRIITDCQKQNWQSLFFFSALTGTEQNRWIASNLLMMPQRTLICSHEWKSCENAKSIIMRWVQIREISRKWFKAQASLM